MKKQNQPKPLPAHRPKGAIGTKTAYARDEFFKCRCSTGFNNCVKELVISGHFKSEADAIHEALQILVARKLPVTFHYFNKIQ